MLHSRYIKDFSFENPGAPYALGRTDPRIDVTVEVDGEQRKALHEVVLAFTVTASFENEIIFLIDLKYAGLFEILNLEGNARTHFIFVEAPRMLFPFIERIIADVVRDGGMMPLNLTPPDFLMLYQQQPGIAGEQP